VTADPKDDEPFLPYVFMQKLRDNRGLSKYEKLVAFVLVSHANEDNNLVWPSNATIAAESGLTINRVKAALTGLKDAGVQHPLGRVGRGGSMKRALFAPRHDAKSAQQATQLKSGASRARVAKLAHLQAQQSAQQACHEVTTKVNTDDKVSSGSWDDKDSTTSEANQGLASNKVPVNGAVALTDDCDPVDRMQNVPPNCLNGLGMCTECQCLTGEPHTKDCYHNPCPGCRHPWGEGHFADCPHHP
jgi:hypothetical protein